MAERFAQCALEGCGSRPQWLEIGEAALHLRRRISTSELAIIGPARDIRDQVEEQERLEALRAELPPRLLAMLGLL